MKSISSEKRRKIHEFLSDPKNKNLSDREAARRLQISRDTLVRWRDRDPEDEPQLSDVEEHRLKRENRELRKQISRLMDVQVVDDRVAEMSSQLTDTQIEVPAWDTRKSQRKNARRRDGATACAMMSDWHLDEVVFLSQMSGTNQYNRTIAEVRCGQFFDNVVQLSQRHIAGVDFDGLYLFLGGDMFSGTIHEELRETNESTIIESILHWTPILASGIRHLADNFEYVHVPTVVGNHGRRTPKPIAKNRVQDNFDWLLYHMLAMALKDDGRITWNISPSADNRFEIHDNTFLFTHGDQFRGGSGIAGAVHPWLLGNARKLKSYTGMGRPYDTLVMGHWHQLTLGIQGIVVNGSLKGYDEYASQGNFPFEPPQQALWLVQPEVGITGRWPIHVLGDNERY